METIWNGNDILSKKGTMTKLIGYIIDVEFVWGFQARVVGLSKTNPSYLYPPPTTFIGALASSIAKRKYLGEKEGRELMVKLCKSLEAIAFRPLNCIPIRYEDINRIITIKVAGGIKYPNPKKVRESFDSPARGKTSLISLDENPPCIRYAVIFKEDKVTRDINKEDFYSINRLGSKESVVSVIDVMEHDDIEIINNSREITSYSFPLTSNNVLKKIISPKWEYEIYIDPRTIHASASYNPLEIYRKFSHVKIFRIPVLTDILSKPQVYVECKTCYKIGREVIIGW